MADFIFDGVNKIMKEPVGAGDTTFDVGRDLYSAWKRWVVISGSQFEEAFIIEGGTPIGDTGIFTGTSYILTNGWKVRAADHNHQLQLNGNLFSDDGIVSSANPTGQSTVFVNASVAAQGVATGGVQQSTLEAIQVLMTEVHRLQGLDASYPMTVTTSSRSFAGVTLDISGDPTSSITVTRQ